MSVNKAILVGNLGADPEVRYGTSGDPIATIRLATSEKWKKDGQQQERTEWHRVVAFGKLAEIMGKYLLKGSQVYIEGKISTRKWTDKEGQEKYTTEIIANDMKMIGGKPDEAHRAGMKEARKASEPDDFGDSEIPF